MSHVGNFDIRYGMLVGVLVGPTVLISDFFLCGLWFKGARRREVGGQIQLIMLIIAIVLAVLAPLFARLLQISGDREVLEVANRATAHLYIINPIKKFEKRARGLFSTHPPIEERIKILRHM